MQNVFQHEWSTIFQVMVHPRVSSVSTKMLASFVVVASVFSFLLSILLAEQCEDVKASSGGTYLPFA